MAKKSNKRGKKASNNKDLNTKEEIKRMPLGRGFRTIVKDSMIDRKATQEEIDKDKSIRRLLDVGAYNLNQIAGMLMIPLERVKKVKNER